MSFARWFLLLPLSGCTTVGGHSREANPLLDTEGAQPDTEVSRAVDAVARRNFDTAQQHLSRTLAHSPTDARALFVQACVFLEQGALKEAAGVVKRLRDVAPTNPEGPVLEALTERRGTHPTENWRDAFMGAWEKAGRPLFEDRGPFTGMSAWNKIESSLEGAWARTDRIEVRLMLAFAGFNPDEASRRWLYTHLEEVQDPRLLRSALEYFASDVHPPEPREALRTRLRRFADQEPTEMQRALLLLVEQRPLDAPLTEAEFRELERIAALPDYRPTPTSSLYAEAERLLRSAGVEPREGGAFSAMVQELGLQGPSLLLQIVKASEPTLSNDHRMRLGRALWSLGERIAAESTLVERMVGRNLRRQGARLLGDSARLAQASAEFEEGLKVVRTTQQLELDAWPLPSLQEAMLAASVEDEWKHLSAFATPTP